MPSKNDTILSGRHIGKWMSGPTAFLYKSDLCAAKESLVSSASTADNSFYLLYKHALYKTLIFCRFYVMFIWKFN